MECPKKDKCEIESAEILEGGCKGSYVHICRTHNEVWYTDEPILEQCLPKIKGTVSSTKHNCRGGR